MVSSVPCHPTTTPTQLVPPSTYGPCLRCLQSFSFPFTFRDDIAGSTLHEFHMSHYHSHESQFVTFVFSFLQEGMMQEGASFNVSVLV